jgi:hypothetical protein
MLVSSPLITEYWLFWAFIFNLPIIMLVFFLLFRIKLGHGIAIQLQEEQILELPVVVLEGT